MIKIGKLKLNQLFTPNLISLPVLGKMPVLKVYGLLTWPKVSILGFPGGTRFWSWGVLGPEEWGDEPRREDTLGLVNDG